MANLLNTKLSAGMLAGVTIIAGGAAQAASVGSTVVNAHAQIALTTTPADVGGTLVFDGFTGPGTLTGVIMTLNSDVYGRGEGPYDGVAALSPGAGSASRGIPSGFSASFDITSDLLAASNPFGVAYAAGDFTGPSVSFALSLTQTERCCNTTEWNSSAATLEYVYAVDVPLPAALPLMIAGLAGLAALGRRRG